MLGARADWFRRFIMDLDWAAVVSDFHEAGAEVVRGRNEACVLVDGAGLVAAGAAEVVGTTLEGVSGDGGGLGVEMLAFFHFGEQLLVASVPASLRSQSLTASATALTSLILGRVGVGLQWAASLA